MSTERHDSDFETYLQVTTRLYTYVMESMDSYNKPHDYGDGQILSMVEMHTLSMIADHPGLCVTDVAKMWNRTLGAATKNVNKLQKKGYVIKKKEPGNNKSVHLFLTEEGMHLDLLHKKYDRAAQEKSIRYLTERHSREELLAFEHVLESLIALNQQEI